MALQSSGAISLGDVEGEFGGTAPTSLSEYYSAAAGVPASGEISLSDFYGTSARATINLSTGATNNYNIYTQASADPSYVAGQSDVIVTVSGRVGSTSTATPAMDTGVFASGDTVKIIVNDWILGKGGAGGVGGNASAANNSSASSTAGANGSAGGTALVLQFPISLDNQSEINGGGGGGAGGGGAAASGRANTKSTTWYKSSDGGGGGGAGAGKTQSAGGAGGIATSTGSGTNVSDNGDAGAVSTEAAGGAGGAGGTAPSISYVNTTGGNGGAGGGHGSNGANGSSGSASANAGGASSSVGGTGGATGLAIQTNGNSITYITTGTIAGGVV